jgi:hypothetical protein
LNEKSTGHSFFFFLVNCEEARNTEESSMMNDARQWINAGQTFLPFFLGGGGGIKYLLSFWFFSHVRLQDAYQVFVKWKIKKEKKGTVLFNNDLSSCV